MDFLDRFPQRDRDRLLGAATVLRLQRGDTLIRSGERGGDLFRVVEGDVEVVDTRSNPPVILEVLGRGSLVGEMAFLDERTRSADVRAADTAVCQRWARPALMRLIDQDPSFAAVFYRTLAELVVTRARSVASHALTGGLRRAGGAVTDTASVAAAQHHAESLVGALVSAEPVLRRDHDRGTREILALLHTFQATLPELVTGLPDADQADAGNAAARVLHPYLMRSHLGELALDQTDGHVGDSHAVAHILSGEVAGDGPVGEILDRWLCGLPTARGLRERHGEALGQVLAALPADPPARVTVINGSGSGAATSLLRDLRRVGGEVSVVEFRRERLLPLQSHRSSQVKLRLVQEEPLALLRGAPRWTPPPQHVVLADALLEYLPDQVAVSLLAGLRAWLAPRGTLVLTALGESEDDPLWRFLLDWPTVRRGQTSLARLVESAGLREVRVYAQGGAGLVAVGLGPTEGDVRAGTLG